MKTKEKTRKYAKVSLKNIIIFLASIIIVLYCIIFYNYYFARHEVYAKEVTANIENQPEVKISSAKPIQMEEIIKNYIENDRKEEYLIEEIDLEYITKYQANVELPKDMIQVIQEGRQGKQEITKKRIYENGEMISEEQVSSKVTKAAVNKIVEIGAGSKSYQYRVKVGDMVYVTSDRAEIRIEPNEESKKVATLTKGKQLKVLAVQGNWYQITGEGTTGYIKAESTTYRNQNNNEIGESNTSSQKNITKLSFDMPLNKPSGLSLEQFKKVLTDGKDKNKIFSNHAEYFYYIEKQYHINGIFVAAVGIHESSWGTSKIAKDKNNLFGYGAYDSNPYHGAYEFSEYSESIDLLARVFVKYYLNPKGTSIYGGEKAVGSYYSGPTLTGVNKRYATDKNWATAVYGHMKYLYNKL